MVIVGNHMFAFEYTPSKVYSLRCSRASLGISAGRPAIIIRGRCGNLLKINLRRNIFECKRMVSHDHHEGFGTARAASPT